MTTLLLQMLRHSSQPLRPLSLQPKQLKPQQKLLLRQLTQLRPLKR
jgi:hypothetical protein